MYHQCCGRVRLALLAALWAIKPFAEGIFINSCNTAPTKYSRLLVQDNDEEPAPDTLPFLSFLAPQDLRAYQDVCGLVPFELRLGMGIHFVLHAQPTANEKHRTNTCVPLTLHADASGVDGMVKEIFAHDDNDINPWSHDDVEGRLLYLGTFPFRDIAEAYKTMPVNSGDQASYNIVTNNCAVLMLGVMRLLNIHLTQPEREAVVRALVAADREEEGLLAHYIRESGESERSLGLTNDATDEQLLERLALRQIAIALDGGKSPRPWEQETESGTTVLSAEKRPEPRLQAIHFGTENRKKPATGRSLIVGGIPTNGQEYPFFVQSENVASYFGFPDLDMCGAVLVAPDVIMTTATCYLTFQYSSQVLVGSNVLGITSGPAEWRSIASDIMVHPQFNDTVFDYDFALMKIEAVTLPNLKPITLNSDRANPAPGKDLVTLGYGRSDPTTASYEPTRQLKKVTVKAYSAGHCNRFYQFAKPNLFFCAHAPDVGPCLGDYGGPIFDANLTLVGLLSNGNSCASPGNEPKVYARVSSAIDWIQETICKLSDSSGNYTFCPSFICPVDVNLIGENNSSYVGGAALPSVTGSMTKPAADGIISQSPAAGMQLQPGTSTLVTVTATNTSNFTVSCNWTVSVLPIKLHFYTNYTSKRGKTDLTQTYSLATPFTGKLYSIEAKLDPYQKISRRNDSTVELSFYRVDLSQPSNLSFVQRFKIKGKAARKTFKITAAVRFPDVPTLAYQAFYVSRGIVKGGGMFYYYYGQVKKM